MDKAKGLSEQEGKTRRRIQLKNLNLKILVFKIKGENIYKGKNIKLIYEFPLAIPTQK